MLNLSTFKNRMLTTSGTSVRDENIKNSKHFLETTFFDDASFNPNIKLWNSDNQIKCRITDRKKSSTYGITCKVQILISESLDVGDIIFDTIENTYWICLEIHTIGDSIKQGLVGLCNYTLKFQSSDGTILSYPCIDSTSSTAGINEDKVITTGNAIHTIKLPFDANTVLINTDDRFIIDDPSVEVPQVFAVSKPNRTEFKYGDKGLIELTMKQDTFQDVDGDKPKDRQDLGVCNYFEPTVDPKPHPSGYTLSITSSGDFNLGATRTLTPVIKDDAGNVMDILSTIWTVNYNGMDTSYFNIAYVGNQCRITISDEAYDIIDGTLELTCTIDTTSNTYSGTIIA